MSLLRGLFLNLVFYPSFLFFSPVYAAACFPWVLWGRIAQGPAAARRRLRTAIRWYGRAAIWGLPKPFLRVRYEDRSAERDALRPYIVICNHRSASDPFLMAAFDFDAVQVVNVWPFHIPFLGFFAKVAGYLSVNEMPFEEFGARCAGLLAEGVSIIAFPEGTRARGGVMGQFRSALFRVALENRTPIVPLAISGNENSPRRGSLWLGPGQIRVRRLETVRPETFAGWSPFKLKNHVRALIENEARILDGEAR